MNIAIVIAVVLFCVFVASASAIIVYYPFQEQNANSTSVPTNPIATPSNSINNPASSPTTFGPTIPLYGGTVQLSNLYDAVFTYVIVNRTSSTGEGHDHFGFGVDTYPSTLYPAFAVLNLTYLGNPQNEPWDLKFEGYLVNYTADTGVKEVYLGWFGTNYNPSSSYPPMAFPGSPKGPPQSESFHFNLTMGHLVQGQTPNSVSYGSGNSSLGLWSNGTPNTITVTIQRAGWVTVKGTVPTTITNPSRDVVLQQIQLIKSGDGFVFGSKPTF
jgi:hypothetical protein